MTSIAQRIAWILEPVAGQLPVQIRAWDGSVAGPDLGPMVTINSPLALRRLLWHPGELGAAQAYVSGEIDIDGDLDTALGTVLGRTDLSPVRPQELATAALRLARSMRGLELWGARPPAPSSQARLSGRLHTRGRDRSAIHHHYDLSNDFYSMILDPSMAYSCAYYSAEDMSLEEAQRAKLDLVCTKLGLTPGSTLLDIGCGWGSLALHAAGHFGAKVRAITLAREQQQFVAARVAERGLGERVEVLLCDYRDATGTYDAVSSIEMGEHVGRANYPLFATTLHDRVRPGGRVLIQQMSRTGKYPGGGPFIESFIAPDMYMRPVGDTVGLLEAAGLEVRDVHALREHYVTTVDAWIARFEENVKELTALVGEEVIRVWRLYLVGGGAAFRDGRMGVDQILSVRRGPSEDRANTRVR